MVQQRATWDVGIAIDIMDAALDPINGIDLVVLLSGDGDFDLLLKRIVRSGNTETRGIWRTRANR